MSVISHQSSNVLQYKLFQTTYSPILKKLFLLHCNKEFIFFVAEILLNVLAGNLPVQESVLTELRRFEKEISSIVLNREKSYEATREKRMLLASNRGLLLLSHLHETIGNETTHIVI